MSVWRASPLLAALLLALLVAVPPACGLGLQDSLPVGNPDEVGAADCELSFNSESCRAEFRIHVVLE